jgi:hypothetical protein
MGQHPFNVYAFWASKKRARNKKAAQMDTAVQILTDFMADVPDVDMPPSLVDTASTAIEVVRIAKVGIHLARCSQSRLTFPPFASKQTG